MAGTALSEVSFSGTVSACLFWPLGEATVPWHLCWFISPAISFQLKLLSIGVPSEHPTTIYDKSLMKQHCMDWTVLLPGFQAALNSRDLLDLTLSGCIILGMKIPELPWKAVVFQIEAMWEYSRPQWCKARGLQSMSMRAVAIPVGSSALNDV